jgi:hypothetical protein
MFTLEQCAHIAGLAPDELSLCAVPAVKHKSLLDSYRANLKRGKEAVCKMIVADFWCFRDLGAQQQAADALLVLKLFLSAYPKGTSKIAGGQRGPEPGLFEKAS